MPLKLYTSLNLGSATIVADGVFRTTEVMGIAEDGGDWMRVGARAVTGFGAGTAAGLLAGKAAYFGLISIAGPVGWGVLGAIFMVSLGVGYLASKVGSDFGEAVSNAAWDRSR